MIFGPDDIIWMAAPHVRILCRQMCHANAAAAAFAAAAAVMLAISLLNLLVTLGHYLVTLSIDSNDQENNEKGL